MTFDAGYLGINVDGRNGADTGLWKEMVAITEWREFGIILHF